MDAGGSVMINSAPAFTMTCGRVNRAPPRTVPISRFADLQLPTGVESKWLNL
jgi:hypothetical protein